MAGTDPGGDLRGARATPEPIKFQKKKKKRLGLPYFHEPSYPRPLGQSKAHVTLTID